ncbi:MAG TPA: STAS domain-containing protein [Candidatus Baltobacteraceae bacterium]
MAHFVVFAGEYDLARKAQLRKDLSRLGSAQELVLDVSEVTFIDSTFISELMSLEKARRRKGFPRITVVAPPKSLVRKLFRVTGIVAQLNVVDACSNPNDGSVGSTIVEYL